MSSNLIARSQRTGPVDARAAAISHSGCRGASFLRVGPFAEVAQLVEQWTENPCVPSSSLGLGTCEWWPGSGCQSAARC